MNTATMTYAEVAEGVRSTIAAYAQALDDGRTDDVVATFCADGVMEIPDSGTFEGQGAIRAAYAGFEPTRPQRHMVVNTYVTDWNDHQASAVSDFVFVQKGKSGWAVRLVGRYHDTLENEDGTWRFQRRTMKFEN
jgi:hypothetical protein